MRPDDPRHGTYAGGRVHRNQGDDPCDPCRRAEARYEQARVLDRLSGRPRLVPALGARRRIQALVALGHSLGSIGEALDMTNSGAWALAHASNDTMRATTATKIASLYEQWSMRLPPDTTVREGKAAKYARTVARKHGWPPPLAWDDIDHDPQPHTPVEQAAYDEVAVLRRLNGDHSALLTKVDRVELVRRARGLGWSYRDLTDRAGITKPERYIHATADQSGDTAA